MRSESGLKPGYLPRWAMAVFVVTPLMMLLVPMVHRGLWDLEGPHAADSPWADFLGMLGFYGGYALLAATFVALVHTRLLRRSPEAGIGTHLGWAMLLGVFAMVPQALVFGIDYWAFNIIAGLVSGAMYGVLALLPNWAPRWE